MRQRPLSFSQHRLNFHTLVPNSWRKPWFHFRRKISLLFPGSLFLQRAMQARCACCCSPTAVRRLAELEPQLLKSRSGPLAFHTHAQKCFLRMRTVWKRKSCCGILTVAAPALHLGKKLLIDIADPASTKFRHQLWIAFLWRRLCHAISDSLAWPNEKVNCCKVAFCWDTSESVLRLAWCNSEGIEKYGRHQLTPCRYAAIAIECVACDCGDLFQRCTWQKASEIARNAQQVNHVQTGRVNENTHT